MVTKIKADSFSGTGAVFDGTLAAAVRGVAQNIAVKAASTVSNFTADNSGGTAATSIVQIPDFTLAVVGTNNCIAKAEAETSLGGVRNAISTLITQINLVNAKVGAFTALTDSTGGTSGTGTIAAIDASATGAGALLMSATRGNTVLGAMRTGISHTAVFVNALSEACGVVKLTDNTLVSERAFATTLVAIATSTGAVASGASVVAANAVVTKTDWDAQLAIFANNIASMAAKLNALTASANASAVCSVIAE